MIPAVLYRVVLSKTVEGPTLDDLERMASESWCHTKLNGRCLCGSTDPSPVGLHGPNVVIDGRCSGCGRLKCPDCLLVADQRGIGVRR